MDNHYHLVLETPEANLARGMRHLNRRIYLGDNVFVQRTQANSNEITADENVPGIQTRPPAPSCSAIEQAHPNRNEAIAAAYATGEYSYADIGKHFHLHFIL